LKASILFSVNQMNFRHPLILFKGTKEDVEMGCSTTTTRSTHPSILFHLFLLNIKNDKNNQHNFVNINAKKRGLMFS